MNKSIKYQDRMEINKRIAQALNRRPPIQTPILSQAIQNSTTYCSLTLTATLEGKDSDGKPYKNEHVNYVIPWHQGLNVFPQSSADLSVVKIQGRGLYEFDTGSFGYQRHIKVGILFNPNTNE